MKKLNGNCSGFSLVEVLVAVTILAIGLLAVAQMQVVAISGNDSAQDRTVAIALAEEMVDRVRKNAGNTPGIYHNIDTSGSVSSIQAALADPAETDALNWKSRLEASGLSNPVGTVTVATDSPIDNTATVTVNVRWSWQGVARNFTITTVVETWGT
jgi:type IV pilus assembly protein PilV